MLKNFAATGAGVTTTTTQDPYSANTVLNLQPQDQQTRSTTVADTSGNGLVVTRTGNPSTGWVSPYQATGYWSGLFNGTSDYLTVPSGASVSGTGAFTTEFWVNMTAAQTDSRIISGAANMFTISLSSSGTSLAYGKAGVNNIFVGTITSPLNAWVHIVIARNASSTYRIWVNGSSVSTGTDSNSYTAGTVYLGATAVPSAYLAGYLSNVRITNTDVYGVSNTTITVPTTPLTAVTGTSLLTLQDNRFKDNSTNAFTITTAGTPQATPYWYPSQFTAPTTSLGAGLFNGTSDYLSIPSSTPLVLAGGVWTIEAWVNPTGNYSDYRIIVNKRSGTNAASYDFYLNTSNGYLAFYNGTAYTSTSAPVANTWNHVAAVYDGTNINLYLNGSRVLQSATTNPDNGGNVFIGCDNNGASGYFPGYISNVRIVKGTAVYSGTTYTVPTAPVTAVAGTSLLVNLADQNTVGASVGGQNNTFIDSSGYNWPITRSGTATQGAFTPYVASGYWSGYFDGSSYVTAPNNANLDLGSSDFTIEFWFNPSSVTATRTIATRFNGNAQSPSDIQWTIVQNSATLSLGVYYSSTSSTITFTGALTANTWHHCALVRSGNSIYGYLNGVRSATVPTVTVALTTGAWSTWIGNYIEGGTNYNFIGYVSNFRVVKGTAVYTAATYTVPTTPLAAITNTSLLALQDNRIRDAGANALTLSLSGTPQIQKLQPFVPPQYTTAKYGGSAYFNGSSSATFLTSSSNFTLGASYTVEAWIYTTSGTGYVVGIIAANQPYYAEASLTINSNVLNWNYRADTGSGYTAANFGGGTVPNNQWTHVAVSAVANSAKLFINGVQVGSTTTVPTFTFTPYAVGVGNVSNGFTNSYYTGYISNARVIKGTGVYTGNFAPPTLAPLTNSGRTSAACYTSTSNVNTSFGDNQTVLLTNFVNGSLYDYSTGNDLLTVDNAQTGTTALTTLPSSIIPSHFVDNAIKFDGTGDYLSVGAGSTAGLTFGTGDWTIEFWIYFTSNTGFQTIYDGRPGVAGAYPLLYLNSGTINYYVGSTTAITSIQPAVNTWYFMSLRRSAGTTQLFINGVQSGSSYTDANTYLAPPSTGARIGANYVPNDYLFGYIEDLRISKGVARSATIPTSRLGRDNYTTLLINQAQQAYLTNPQNNTFLDSSTNNFTITRNGTPTQGSLTPYWPNGYWSGYFGATTDYFNTASGAGVANPGTGNFTFEGWYYITETIQNSSYFIIVDTNSTGMYIGYDTAGTLAIGQRNTVTNNSVSYTFPLNQWIHFAVARSGTTIKFFINGSEIFSGTNSADYSGTGTAYFGRLPAVSASIKGYYSNIRIVKGTAVYTSAFTPSTTPLTAITNTSLLTLQSNRFIDGSSNNFAITANGSPQIQPFQPFQAPSYNAQIYGGSIKNPGGTGSRLDVAGTGSIFGSGVSYTMECWYNPTAAWATDYNSIVTVNSSTYPTRWLWDVGCTATGIQTRLITESNAVIFNSSTVAYSLNQWVHLAIVNNAAANTCTHYINGVAAGSRAAVSLTSYATLNLFGTYVANSDYFSNLRIVNGVAVYTGNFTPPTLPLTTSGAISALCYPSTTNVNTSFGANQTAVLINGTNAGILDAAAQSVLTTVGDTLVYPLGNTRSYTKAIKFDGTGDYLSVPSSMPLQLGSNDFTIEAWVFINSLAANGAIVSKYVVSTVASSEFLFWITSTGVLAVALDGAAEDYIASSSGIFALNTWYHVAVTKSGSGTNNVKLWQNGIQVAQGTSTRTLNTTSTALTIGSVGASNYFNGYIDDVRITRGLARYTQNFITSAAALTSDRYTTLLVNSQNYQYLGTEQNNTFLDSSTNNFTITRNGTPTQGAFTPYQPSGYWSGYFGGSDYLSFTDASNVLDVGGAKASIEFWANPNNNTQTSIIFCKGGGSPDFNSSNGFEYQLQFTGGVFKFLYNVSGTPTFLNDPTTRTANQWYHIAFAVSASNTISLFVNGTRVATASSATLTKPTSRTLMRVSNDFSGNYFNGYVSNLNFISGANAYDATQTTITVPTAPLSAVSGTSLLTLQSNRFIDNSSNVFTVTANGTPKVQAFQPFAPAASYDAATYGGSGYFNASSSYLSIATPTATNISANTNFTIEGWIYPIAHTNTAPCIFNNYTNSGLSGVLALFAGHNAFGSTTYNINLNGTIVNGGTIVYNQWSHFAIVRNGTGSSNVVLYINGVSVGTSTSNAALSYNGGLFLGTAGDSTANSSFNGYISNFRWNNSTAIYTAAFTPPTLPLTAVSGTLLLTNFTNAGIYDAAWQNNVTTVGDVTVYPTTSRAVVAAKFDGSGDYLTMPLTPTNTITSGDFTVEYWINASTTAPANQALVGTREGDATNNISWGLYLSGAQLIFAAYNTSNTLMGNLTHQATLSANIWYHCALVRSGSTFTLFVNGIPSTTTIVSSATIQQPGTTLWVGRFGAASAIPNSGSTILAFTGYIQDLRVTRGIARYTGPFTPPSTIVSVTTTAASVTSSTIASATQTYALSTSSGTVNEGSSVTVTLTTTNVTNGTQVPYVITGVTSADIGGASLTGNFTVNSNVATLTINTTADQLTEGNETLTLTLQGITPATSTTVTIVDTSLTPTYSLSSSAATVNEGSSFTITLTTTNVANATLVPYTITGVSSADIGGASLTGNFTVSSNTATLSVSVTADTLTEGTETFTITLNNTPAATVSVTIADTSVYAGLVATGGTITTDATYTYHTFTSSGTFTVSSNPSSRTCDILIVGGGGSGGSNGDFNYSNGGGGGGQVLEYFAQTATTRTITIGGGGGGGTRASGTNAGGSTTVSGIGTAAGGGGGGSTNYTDYGVGGTSGSGYGGGSGGNANAQRNAGGGGGAGGAGAAGGNATQGGGAGGAGVTSTITGQTYGGGGGGGTSYPAGFGSSGGSGGGGGGGAPSGGGGDAYYYGGGGGGSGRASSASRYAGSGSQGIVVIRYTT